MIFRVWGARGSIPVSGDDTVRYGGDTTCASVHTKAGGLLVLDMGTGARRLGNALLEADGPREMKVLFTHAHWDHLMGLPFFGPLYREGWALDFFGCELAARTLRSWLGRAMEAPFFPVDFSKVAATVKVAEGCSRTLEVAGVRCRRFPMSHPNGGCGIRIEEGERSVVFFPDNELGYDHPGGARFEDYVAFVRGADLLVHDAMYRPDEWEGAKRGWGHSVHLEAARLAAEAGAKRLLLWHHDPDRTDDQVDRMVSEAQEELGKRGSETTCEGARTDQALEV